MCGKDAVWDNQFAKLKTVRLDLVQISAMGDPEGNAKGGFVILDQDLKVQSTHLGFLARKPFSERGK